MRLKYLIKYPKYGHLGPVRPRKCAVKGNDFFRLALQSLCPGSDFTSCLN